MRILLLTTDHYFITDFIYYKLRNPLFNPSSTLSDPIDKLRPSWSNSNSRPSSPIPSPIPSPLLSRKYSSRFYYYYFNYHHHLLHLFPATPNVIASQSSHDWVIGSSKKGYYDSIFIQWDPDSTGFIAGNRMGCYWCFYLFAI